MEKGRLAGVAWALNGLLYAIPFHASQGRCYLPRALTDDHGISIDNLYAGSGDANLCHAVSEIATLARQYLDVAQHDRLGMAFHARPAFAGLSLVAADLKRLKKAHYDVFSVRPTGPFWRRWLLIRDMRWGYLEV